jgi:sugar/nucleoside kinase (ribokinase family)
MSILCVGQLVADVVLWPVDGLPVASRTNFVEELELVAGGCAANTAAVLAKLGVEARLVALIGDDSLGDAALADLKTAGVRLDTVLREPTVATSAVVVVVSSSAERSFLYREGGNEQLANRHIPDGVLQAARIVHVGGAMKLMNLDLAELMARAKSFGCITSLDTDWDPRGNWLRLLRPALQNVDYLLTNQEEASKLSGHDDPRAAAQALLGNVSQAVIVKQGEDGALLASGAGVNRFPAYRVQVRDTTCAGDAFVAGFLLGIHRGWRLDNSMRLANAAGALCTTQLSHRGITSLEDTLRLVDSQPEQALPAAADHSL